MAPTCVQRKMIPWKSTPKVNIMTHRIVCSASQNQVTGSNIDDKIGKVVDNVVMTVEICLQDAILTAMD